MPGGFAKWLRLGRNRAIAGALAGGSIGAVNEEDRLKGAARGALFGAGAGFALGGPSRLAGNAITGIPRAGLHILGVPGGEGRAANIIGKALERSGMTPEEVAQRVAEARARGVPLSPIDISGPLRNLGESVAVLPNGASSTISQSLLNRQAAQGSRVLEHIRKALGNEGNLYGMADDIMTRRAAEAAPLYEKAYAGTADSPELSALLPRLQQAGALGRAKEIAAIEGNELGAPPAMKSWDYIKRGLEDQIEAYRDPVTGELALDDKGRALADLRSELLKHLDAVNPDYAAARQAYAGHSSMLDALHLGRRFMRGDEEVVAQRFADLSPAEQEMFRVGAVRQLRGIIKNIPDGANVVRKMFGTPDKRERLRMLFPDEDSFNEFSHVMGLEDTTSQTKNQVTANSASARRIAGSSELLADAVTDIAARGSVTNWARHQMVRQIMDRISGIDEKTANSLADYLLNGANPSQGERILRSMNLSDRDISGILGAAIGGGTAGYFATDQGGNARLTPVAHDPFAAVKLTPVDHDPFGPGRFNEWMGGLPTNSATPPGPGAPQGP